MRNRLIIMLTVIATAGLAASNPSTSSSQASTAPKADQSITITGCLAAGPNNTFTLTAAPRAVRGGAATTPAGSKVAKTIAYTLSVPNQNDLRQHVGHTIQVSGTEAAPELTTTATDTRTDAEKPRGTSGGVTPTVQTTTQTQIVTRRLNVRSVKAVSSACDLIK